MVSHTRIDESSEAVTSSLVFKNSISLMALECPGNIEQTSPDFIFQPHINPS